MQSLAYLLFCWLTKQVCQSIVTINCSLKAAKSIFPSNFLLYMNTCTWKDAYDFELFLQC